MAVPSDGAGAVTHGLPGWLGPTVPKAIHWSSGLYALRTVSAAAWALSVSAPSMLGVRSTISTRSTGAEGFPPHAPLQAAEITVWVVPVLMPTAPPKPYCTVAASSRTTVLQVSPSSGMQTELQILALHVQEAFPPGSQMAGTSLNRGEPPTLPMMQRNPTVTPGGRPPG